MSDLRELYQQVILDHSRKPRNFHELGEATCSVEGHNPLCGDNYRVYVDVEDSVIKDISFTGTGCAISMASGSLMTSALKGKSIDEADEMFEAFHDMVTSGKDDVIKKDVLGKLAVFSGVREFPLRVKCASLAWHAMKSAIHGEDDTISTE